MSVTLAYASGVTVVETVETGTPAATDANSQITHNQYNTTASLTSATTPPVTKTAFFLQALSGGAATIDLTALSGTNGATIDGTGLKVQAFKMKNLGANTMSITFGGSNPYELTGSDFKITLTQNQEVLIYGNDATPDIGGAACEMDLAGTSAQTAEISIVMG